LSNVAAEFREACALRLRGQIAQAKVLFEKVCAEQPNHCDAIRALGLIEGQVGNFARAARMFARAIELEPTNAVAHDLRGLALHELGQSEAALASFEQAIAIKEDYAMAHYNRGNTQSRLARWAPALASYDRALALGAGFAELHLNRGLVLQELRRFDAALQSYQRAVVLKPNCAEGHSNRGNILAELGRWPEALDCYDRAIRIRPDYTVAHYNRGNVLRELKQLTAAIASYDRALALDPNFAAAYHNRGLLHQERRDFERALADYDRSLGLSRDNVEVLSNRGGVLRELKRFEAALASFDAAIEIRSDYAEARKNRALVSLLIGDFERGWRDYEWRWREADTSTLALPRTFSARRWSGDETLAGKSILIHNEQGFGDTLQFSRYVALLGRMGARVVLEVQRPLARLLASLEGATEIIIKRDKLPQTDFQCPLLSLPLAFNTRLETIPATPYYLRADPAAAGQWEMRLGPRSRPRVGLAWRGSADYKSIALGELLDGLPPGIQYVSLQKDLLAQERELIGRDSRVLDFAADLTDFADTAALCSCLDLVVSVDTSVAHLSGALGLRTWLLALWSPDWRWLLDRTDSPWYPSMTIYRQQHLDHWDGVLEHVRGDLQRTFGKAVPP
jgi:tetratricopeptide (TPR) repeat protein